MKPKQRDRDLLRWAALIAALVVTMQGEYALAVSAGFDRYVAVGVPAALDIYAVRALRAHRDVRTVVLAMITVNSLSHLVAAHLIPISIALVIAVSAIAPLVVWRVHALAESTQPNQEAESGTAPANQVLNHASAAQVQVPPNHAPQVPNQVAGTSANQVPNLPNQPTAQVPNHSANQVPPQVPNLTPNQSTKQVPAAGPNLVRNQPKRTKPKTPPAARSSAAATGQQTPATPPVTEQVRQILDLIEANGFEEVKLATVMDQTGMKKTTAYNALIDARAIWQEQHENGTNP